MKTAVAGLGALAVGAAYCFSQFEESNKVAAQTDAVLKSTGGAANVTAQQVSDLATAISNKSSIDDEAIQSGENMLLTFKNIRNEAGAGNDIFNQAAMATTDMAAGMAAASGGAVDMKSASIQLGKALNDPVAGITALTRVGVTFTEQQKAQITKLTESGKTLQAQKIILAEVNSEFAGSAEAGKTASAMMSVQFGNLAEAIGGVLAPAINAVLGVIIAFFTFLAKYPALLVTVAAAFGAIAVAMIANSVAASLAAEEGIVFAAVTAYNTAVTLAHAAALGVVTAAQWLWNAALTANPIGLIIVAIAAVIAIIVILVKHFHLADNIMNVLKKTVDVVWGFIKAYVGLVVKLVIGYMKLWIAAIGLVVRVVMALVGVVSRAFQNVYGTISQWLGKAGNFIRNTWDGIVRFFAGIGGKLARAGKGMWDFLWNGFKAVINLVIGGWNQLIHLIDALQIHIHLNPPGPGSIDFDWSGLGIPPIPTLAKGGQVMRTGLALVHEGERFSGIGNGDWGSTTNVYVAGSVISEHDLAETVQKALLRSKRRSGALGLA